MYGLDAADLELQRRARDFADELIPCEAHRRGARRPAARDLAQRHHERALELGPLRHEHAHLGRRARPDRLQQVLVQEQGGRVTNGLAWCLATPPSWWPEVANDHQRERWLLPTVRGELPGVLRDHRGGRRLRPHRPGRDRRSGTATTTCWTA